MVLPLFTGGIRSVFVVVARRLVERGQVGVDVVGFGDAEVGIEGQGLAPVVAGLLGIAGGVVGVGEAVVGAGLLVAVTGLAGQGELDHNRSKQSILVWVWICVGALRVVEGRL